MKEMFKILIVLVCARGLSSLSVSTYYNINTLGDTLCSSPAAIFSGQTPWLFVCARKCMKTIGCMSFYYNEQPFECYVLNTVIRSSSGCESKPGMRYYLKQEFRCYDYSPEDNTQMSVHQVPEQTQCEVYQYHIYTAGNNQEYGDCSDGCECCEWKGCYSGNPLYFQGTWKWTENERFCQRWDSQFPHIHENKYAPGFPNDNSVYDAHNFCRDPDASGAPWCYTVDPLVRWEFCGIPQCWSP